MGRVELVHSPRAPSRPSRVSIGLVTSICTLCLARPWPRARPRRRRSAARGSARRGRRRAGPGGSSAVRTAAPPTGAEDAGDQEAAVLGRAQAHPSLCDQLRLLVRIALGVDGVPEMHAPVVEAAGRALPGQLQELGFVEGPADRARGPRHHRGRSRSRPAPWPQLWPSSDRCHPTASRSAAAVEVMRQLWRIQSTALLEPSSSRCSDLSKGDRQLRESQLQAVDLLPQLDQPWGEARTFGRIRTQRKHAQRLRTDV
jgi:hypothetical protein